MPGIAVRAARWPSSSRPAQPQTVGGEATDRAGGLAGQAVGYAVCDGGGMAAGMRRPEHEVIVAASRWATLSSLTTRNG